ncbi:MAG: glycosyltransferase family 1 protein [Gemmatimonas sp.]
MRIVFFSYGTRGDAQPQVALASGLVARGIEARVAAPENLRSFVERAGVEYAPLHGNSQTILESEEGQRWLRSGNVRAFMSSMAEIARELDPHVFASGLEAARGADVIVGGTLTEELSVTLAEHLRIPFTFAHTIPCEPTGAYPCPLVTTAKLPWAFLNRATYALFRRLAFPIHRDAINVFRRELGLPPQTATAVGRARELGRAGVAALEPPPRSPPCRRRRPGGDHGIHPRPGVGARAPWRGHPVARTGRLARGGAAAGVSWLRQHAHAHPGDLYPGRARARRGT